MSEIRHPNDNSYTMDSAIKEREAVCIDSDKTKECQNRMSFDSFPPFCVRPLSPSPYPPPPHSF